MRKGQEKLLKKARENGYSKKKLTYLSSDEPLWYLNEAYIVLYFYSDEELGNYEIMDALMDTAKQYAEQFHYTLQSAFTIIRCKCLAPTSVKLDVLQKLLTDTDYTSTDKVKVIELLASTGMSLAKAKEIYKKSNIKRNPNIYLDIICIRGNNLELKESYAEYIQQQDNIEEKYQNTKKWCWYAFSHNIPLWESIQAEFSFNGYMELQLDKIPGIKDIYTFDEKHKYRDVVYIDSEIKDTLIKAIEPISDKKVSIRAVCKAVKIYAEVTPGAINISFSLYNKIYINKEDNKAYCRPDIDSCEKLVDFILFFDGNFFVKKRCRGTYRTVPVTLRDVVLYGKEFERPFFDLFHCVAEKLQQKQGFVIKDFCRNIENSPAIYYKVLPPVPINDCSGEHSMDMLMKDSYKGAYIINWNKTDLCIGYLIMKSISWVRKDDTEKLIAVKDACFVDDKWIETFMERVSGKTLNSCIANFLASILFSVIPEKTYWRNDVGGYITGKDFYQTIMDYISLCRKLKRKVKMNFRSAKKLKDVHDRLANEYAEKDTPLVRVPSKSRFYELRKMLPEEFEWIRTRKRIIEEGRIMHHCVATYADKVNDDECAIYSFVYEPTRKRYTIEFIKKGERFIIEQIQSECDRGCPREVKRYVNSYISRNNS